MCLINSIAPHRYKPYKLTDTKHRHKVGNFIKTPVILRRSSRFVKRSSVTHMKNGVNTPFFIRVTHNAFPNFLHWIQRPGLCPGPGCLWQHHPFFLQKMDIYFFYVFIRNPPSFGSSGFGQKINGANTPPSEANLPLKNINKGGAPAKAFAYPPFHTACHAVYKNASTTLWGYRGEVG